MELSEPCAPCPPGAGMTSTCSELRKQALRLALPAAGEQFLGVLVGTINTILVGHLGASSLAAVGLSSTIIGLAGTFFSAVSIGATALIAQAIGANDRSLANRTLEQAMLVAIALGMGVLALLLLLARPSMILMGAQDEALGMGVTYITCLAFVQPLNALLMVGNASLRGSGDTRTPMMVMGGVNLLNLIVSYTLIRGLGPIRPLGVLGAGLGAAVATAAGCFTVINLLLRGQGNLMLVRLFGRPRRDLLKRLLDISLPAGGESLLMSLAFTTYARSIASLGTVPYAAYLIAQRVESLSSMPGSGFAVAATTLSGQSLGAGNPTRARQSVLRTIEIAVSFALPLTCVALIFPRFMLGIFTNDQEVIAQGIAPLRIVALAFPVMSTAFSLAGGLRGAGDTRTTMIVTGIGAWLVRVPLAILSVTSLRLGLPGVQSSMVLDWTTRMLLLIWRFRPAAWGRRINVLYPRAQIAK